MFYFGKPLGRWTIEFWPVAIPVFIAVMGIGVWIGWTMATTPPPIPTEEIEKEEEATSESKAEEAEKLETDKETKTQRKRRKSQPLLRNHLLPFLPLFRLSSIVNNPQ